MNLALKKITSPADKERGFTIIELLVVFSIIAVLGALILASLTSAQKGSRDARRRSDLKQYQTALVAYYADKGTLPDPDSFGPGNNHWPVQSAAVEPYNTLKSGYMSAFIQDPKYGTGAYGYYYYYAAALKKFLVCSYEEQKAGTLLQAGASGISEGPCNNWADFGPL